MGKSMYSQVKKTYRRLMSEACKEGKNLPTIVNEKIEAFQKQVEDQVNGHHLSAGEGMQAVAQFRELYSYVLEYGQIHGMEPGNPLIARFSKATEYVGLNIKYSALGLAYRFRNKFANQGEMQSMINKMQPADLKREMEKRCKYVCSDDVTAVIWTALMLGKPLLIEGPPGCGKTELAKVLATIFQSELIRLQCYEGIDEAKALYEWNYQKQILDIQNPHAKVSDPYSEDYLLERPLLKALRSENCVLLIDEVDKTDLEFEAYLLEILSDFQVTVPELGTIAAKVVPPVILTSNAVRDLGDALRRRCVWLWLDFPTVDKEAAILMKKTDGLRPPTALQIAKVMDVVRTLPLVKLPSISESLDLATAVVKLNHKNIESSLVDQLATLFIKNREDLTKLQGKGGGKWVIDQTKVAIPADGNRS